MRIVFERKSTALALRLGRLVYCVERTPSSLHNTQRETPTFFTLSLSLALSEPHATASAVAATLPRCSVYTSERSGCIDRRSASLAPAAVKAEIDPQPLSLLCLSSGPASLENRKGL